MIFKKETPKLKILRARSFGERLRGLMFYADMPGGYDALLLEPCNSVHCFFMRFAIDAVFLDADNKILKISTCKPWSIGPIVWKAKKVLELRSGTALAYILGENLDFSN